MPLKQSEVSLPRAEELPTTNKHFLNSNVTIASDTEKRAFEEAPSSLKSTVWEYFGFNQYDEDGKKTVNKQTTVCKYCFTTVSYINENTPDKIYAFTLPSPGCISYKWRKES